MAANGIKPVIHIKYLILKYQGFWGIVVGHGFILQGIFILFVFIPKKDPINTKGVEQNSQRLNKDINAENLIDSPPSKIRKKLEKIKIQKIIEGYNKAVNKAFFNQWFPLKDL